MRHFRFLASKSKLTHVCHTNLSHTFIAFHWNARRYFLFHSSNHNRFDWLDMDCRVCAIRWHKNEYIAIDSQTNEKEKKIHENIKPYTYLMFTGFWTGRKIGIVACAGARAACAHYTHSQPRRNIYRRPKFTIAISQFVRLNQIRVCSIACGYLVTWFFWLARGSSGVQTRAYNLQPATRSPFLCHDSECVMPPPPE